MSRGASPSPRPRATTILAGLLLATTGAAQRTWIVDAANGPGADFPDLPHAASRIGAGDTLLVRAGTYSGTSFHVPVRIVGLGEVTVAGYYGIWIDGVPPGSHVEVSGIRSAAVTAGVILRDIRGTATVRDLLLAPGLYGPALDVSRCAYVAVSGRVDGILASQSTLSLSSATVVSRFDPTRGSALTDCVSFVSDSFVQGGPSGVGLFLERGTTRVDGATAIHAGAFTSQTAPGIRITDGDLRLDPGATVLGTGAPPIEVVSGAPPRIEPVPGLGVRGGAPGGSATLRLTAPPGVPAVLVASGSAVPTRISSGLLIADRSAVVVIAGMTSATGRLTTAVPVPSSSQLLGTPVHFQGLVALPEFRLSNPGSLLVR